MDRKDVIGDDVLPTVPSVVSAIQDFSAPTSSKPYLAELLTFLDLPV